MTISMIKIVMITVLNDAIMGLKKATFFHCFTDYGNNYNNKMFVKFKVEITFLIVVTIMMMMVMSMTAMITLITTLAMMIIMITIRIMKKNKTCSHY